jgi:protocatechuate 3,4-dioxygenase beta subunit
MGTIDGMKAGRRTVLQGLGAGALSWGCGGGGDDGTGGSETDGASTGANATTGSSAAGSSGSDPSAGSTDGGGTDGGGDTTDGSDATDATGNQGNCDPAAAWAAGGTVAMTAQDCYPDPFAGGVGTCMLLCQTTAGPCTADTVDRQDVSEGYVGLPVRLALKIVSAEDCTPVPDAFVEIWHTHHLGVYSGETPSNICNGNDPVASQELFFRGSRVTDAEGRVDFDTCYPGWYPGRAIHIHFRVVIGDSDYLVSQLFFDDALNTEICTTHPDYAAAGAPNTQNGNDNVIGGVADLSPYVLDTARMADGAMLASKVIAIRSSTGDPQCTA